MTAKIDTQAPERIWITSERSLWPTHRSFTASDLDHSNDDGTSDYQEYVRADLVPAPAVPDDVARLVQRLRIVGGRAGLDIIDKDGTLSAYMILGQTRSIVVDMLMVCGLSRESAVAHLVPTSQHPAYPPEVWGCED